MLKATEAQKKALRKVKGKMGNLQDLARNTLVSGCTEQGAYVQFGVDMETYNLWEALLYAKGYEDDGHYRPETVQAALDAVIEKAKL